MSDLLTEIRRRHDHGHTGVMVLARAEERMEAFFHEGMIEAVVSTPATRRLGDYLVESGFLEANLLDGIQLEAQRLKIPFGEAAARRESVSRPEAAVAVRRQALDHLLRAIKDGFVAQSFTGAIHAYYIPARVGFPDLLLELSRLAPAPFDDAGDTRVSLCPEIDLSVFSWSTQELYVLTGLVYPNTVDNLLATTALTEPELRGTLGTLRKLGVIETMEALEIPEEYDAIVPKAEFPYERLIPVVSNAMLNDRVEVVLNPVSFASEQFKNLKVQLASLNTQDASKVFTISSPDSEDGKSLVSANLAFAFAMDPGRRVAIIDCDLRSPSVQKYLGVTAEPGLLQYLSNGHGPYCYMRRIHNLYFMTTGGVAENPIEALSMRKMKQLIEELKKDFDTVILDAPPFSPIADARVVTGLSDGLIMVIRRGKTSYSSADRAFKVVDRSKLLGVVFNDVKPMLFHTYQNSRYYQYGSPVYLKQDKAKKYLKA